jgi:hypothetical protein
MKALILILALVAFIGLDFVPLNRDEIFTVEGFENKELTKTLSVKNFEHYETKNYVMASGDAMTWMIQAGISEKDWGYVDYIMSHESGWRPGAVNAIGCVGLGQNCGSWLVEACPLWQVDPVCQLKRFAVYANERYGGWEQAYNEWLWKHWW